jgi:hypothetical protein
MITNASDTDVPVASIPTATTVAAFKETFAVRVTEESASV